MRRPSQRAGRAPPFLRHMGLAVVAALFAAVIAGAAAPAKARPRRRKEVKLSEISDALRAAERAIVDAMRAAGTTPKATAEQLAKRLVEGQYELSLGNAERAAIIFLDLIENHPESRVSAQAVHFLGRALVELGMRRWAAEVFSRNLSDTRPLARAYHQLSVAALFDLHVLRREPGFARRPGLSATPEARARLASLGLSASVARPLRGPVGEADAQRLEKWARSFPPEHRVPALSYAYGRYLYFAERYDEALEELDRVARPELGMRKGLEGAEAAYRVRAAYFAAATVLAAGDREEALRRFSQVATARSARVEDATIAQLAQLAVARIHHDEGRFHEAEAAYRRIGRDSPFFSEALYELAWTYLRGGRFDEAEHALDLLLAYDPDSPLAAEIRQLRGKVKIQRRDYPAAEKEFLAMRREFDRMAKKLSGRLALRDDAVAYFAAVLGDQMAHFQLDRVVPAEAMPIARNLRHLVHAEAIARTTGELEAELHDTRDMLARMEEAVQARERARLFTDLGAHLSAMEGVEGDLLAAHADLVRRLASRSRKADIPQLEADIERLFDAVEAPPGSGGRTKAEVVARLQAMGRRVHHLRQQIQAYRAQLVAAERYYESTRRRQKIDHEAFLRQAAELRERVRSLDERARSIEDRLVRAETRLRYDDPLFDARKRAKASMLAYLGKVYADYEGAADPQTRTLWRRASTLWAKAQAAREALDQAAAVRLSLAMGVLVEERENLDRYLVEFRDLEKRAKGLVAQVLTAGYRDVVGELRTLVLRSEVGLLDVAWAMKEVEQEAVKRLEQERSRTLQELERLVEDGLAEVGR